MTEGITVLKTMRISGGKRGMYQLFRHTSSATNTAMTMCVFLPSTHPISQQKESCETNDIPVLFWLSGMTHAEGDFWTSFISQMGSRAFESAEKHGVALAIPERCPRGEDVPQPTEFMGVKCPFYLDATYGGYEENYQMYKYVTQEMPAVLEKHFGLLHKSISGFSLGGDAALCIAMRSPHKWVSVSALAPMYHPTGCALGQHIFQTYLGSVEAGILYDPTMLLRSRSIPIVDFDYILIDQGSQDDWFAREQLLPNAFLDAADKCRQRILYNLRDKFDHSFHFVSSFIDNHISFHAKRLQKLLAMRPYLPSIDTDATKNQPITCRAIVAQSPGKLAIQTVTVAPPGPAEVRIKVVASSVCHHDIRVLRGEDTKIHFPCIIGHEAGAVIESVGPGVTDFMPGDHVITCEVPQCCRCFYCEHRRSNVCLKLAATQRRGVMTNGTTRFHDANSGQEIYHSLGCSTFSQYTVLSQFSCIKIPKMAPLNKVCLLGCGVTSGLGAVWNICRIEKGSTVAVFGVGAVGSAVIQGSKIAGASRIIAVDDNPSVFSKATEFGATECVDITQTPIPIQNHIAGVLTEHGVDYAFESKGNAKFMQAAFESTTPASGECCIIGAADVMDEITTDAENLLTGRILKGTVLGGFKPRRDIPHLVQQYINGKLDLDGYVTQELDGFDKILEAIEMRQNRHTSNCLRAIVKY